MIYRTEQSVRFVEGLYCRFSPLDLLQRWHGSVFVSLFPPILGSTDQYGVALGTAYAFSDYLTQSFAVNITLSLNKKNLYFTMFTAGQRRSLVYVRFRAAESQSVTRLR